MKISIVIPVYNSEDSLRELVERINAEMAIYSFEIIFVNDGSRDRSLQILYELAMCNSNITVLDLARNFGQHNAIMAGLRLAQGDIVVLMDDDLQNPPAEIHKLIAPLLEGSCDVVYGRYLIKKHSWFRNLGSAFNDRVADVMIHKPHDLYFCAFKAMRSFVVAEITRYDGAYPYIDGLIFRATQSICSVVVDHKERNMGTSNYTLRKLIRLWLNMFTNFSILPLRVVTVFGLLMAMLSFVFAFMVIVERFWFDFMPQGWASLIVSIMLLAGIQLASIGLLGEYLGRTYLSINQTPQYVIREIVRHAVVPDEKK